MQNLGPGRLHAGAFACRQYYNIQFQIHVDDYITPGYQQTGKTFLIKHNKKPA